MNSGSTKVAVGKTLANLIDYTGSHFHFEEELFTKYDYPEQKDHKVVHGKLVA